MSVTHRFYSQKYVCIVICLIKATFLFLLKIGKERREGKRERGREGDKKQEKEREGRVSAIKIGVIFEIIFDHLLYNKPRTEKNR